jgi:hypothetical protein
MDEEKKQYEIKVYKIWYADAPDDIYIGSTKESLSRRMTGHRCCANRGRTTLIYKTMCEKGINDFQYVMLGCCMVSDKDGQRMYEQRYIADLRPSLNTYRAYATDAENKQKHKEYEQTPERKQKHKEYEQTPERKQKQKERRQTPEYKQKHKEYMQTLEYKQKQKQKQKQKEHRACKLASVETADLSR